MGSIQRRTSLLATLAMVLVALALPGSSMAGYQQATFFGQPVYHDPCGMQMVVPATSCPRFTGQYQPVVAWRWNATSRTWSKVTMQPNQSVYTAYFAPGWTWIWTGQTGWIATETMYLGAAAGAHHS